MYHIEKSGFHAGCYVGYAQGFVFSISAERKRNGKVAYWKCYGKPGYFQARTLKELDDKLGAIQ
jgi:hypothetical protein